MATLIRTNGEQEQIQPKNGTDFQLEELNAYIGGWIEIVRIGGGEILVVDEEGLCKELPINTTASILAGYTIVGPAVRCKSSQVK